MLRYGWEIYQFLIKGFAKANKRFPNPKEIKFIENTAVRIRNKLMDAGVDLEKLNAEDAVKLYANPPKLPAKPKSKPAGIEALPLQDPKLREQALKKKLEAQNLQSRESLQTRNKPTSVMVYDKNHKPGMAGMEVELKNKPTVQDLIESGEITKGTAPKTDLAKIKDKIKKERETQLELFDQIPGIDITDDMFADGGRVELMAGGILKGKKILDALRKVNKTKTVTKVLTEDELRALGIKENIDKEKIEKFISGEFTKIPRAQKRGLVTRDKEGNIIIKDKYSTKYDPYRKIMMEQEIKKGQGQFTAAEAIIARLKNTIKDADKMGMDPSEVKYVKNTFPNFIKELEKNPKLAENENVWNQLMSDLPENQRFIKYDDGTVDFQIKKPSHTFKLREDLDTDRKGPIAPNDDSNMFDNIFDKMFSEYEYDQFIKSGRKPNADGGLITMFMRK